MTYAIDARVASASTPSDRIVPVQQLFGNERPKDVIVLPNGDQPVALCCPVTATPLTNTMAAVAGLRTDQLADMVQRRAPLGVSPETWDVVVDVMTGGDSPLDALYGPRDGIDLSDGPLSVAVGGSSIACFSSRNTTLTKKSFPQSETEFLHRAGGSVSKESVATYRHLQRTHAALPLAPWYGIMHRLGLEKRPDVDVQVHSDVIDRVMLDRAANGRPGIRDRMIADRLNRWNLNDIFDAFPGFGDLNDLLVGADVPIEFEFLGPKGPQQLAKRPDWWHIDVPGRITRAAS
jgi:hypothetical protein